MGVFPLMREHEVAQRQSAGSQVLPVYLQSVYCGLGLCQEHVTHPVCGLLLLLLLLGHEPATEKSEIITTKS